ncbi:MAG: palmitoyltransferase pfa5 [Claussenomyces sp. TS43310]|nr:MAG: palmitoyltransferase pfa5 [Claussenomyces sp. TS43310]
MPLTPVQRAVSRWTGHIIPAILIGIVGYATYVFVVRVCIHYLLFGSLRRHGVAIALLVVYFILFLPMAASYMRLLLIVKLDPGYVPLGPGAKSRRIRGSEKPRGPITSEMSHNLGHGHGSPETAVNVAKDPDSPGLEDFYTKDVFVCEFDGKPKFCSECGIWKPDRTHHCSDVERCVRKMDHYCPWAGGIVAENSFKFFLQFVTYTWLYCFYLVVVLAIYVHEQKASSTRSLDPQFAVILGLAAFFGLFTLGMSGSSFHFAIMNLTTIENLNRKTRIWQLAVFLPQSEYVDAYRSGWATPFPTVTYPLPKVSSGSTSFVGQSDNTNRLSASERDAKAIRKFAILKMEPGENPYDLGLLENWKSVMGTNPLDWILPIRRSPCCTHEGTESQFALGPAVKRLRERYLINPEPNALPPRSPTTSPGIEMQDLNGAEHGDGRE